MVDMEMVFKAVDQMTPEELTRLRDYLEAREKVIWWVVPPENIEAFKEALRPMQEDAENMTEAEINAAIDDAIAEVRSERKQNQSRD